MDLVQFVTSVNKVSVLAFLVTVGILIYEFAQLSKSKKKQATPTVPAFDPTAKVEQLGQNNTIKVAGVAKGISRETIIVLLVIMLIILGGVSVFTAINSRQLVTPTKQESKVEIQEVQSQGIRYFTQDWQELKGTDLASLKPGDTILCAVATIPNTDIDKARIRVNTSLWSEKDVTTSFNTVYNVFYKPYTLASTDAQLRVEAQLHSTKDGWLGN